MQILMVLLTCFYDCSQQPEPAKPRQTFCSSSGSNTTHGEWVHVHQATVQSIIFGFLKESDQQIYNSPIRDLSTLQPLNMCQVRLEKHSSTSPY